MVNKDRKSTSNFYAFEAFEPLTGEPPDFPQNKFREIAYRARKILAKRSREEILNAADLLDWLLQTNPSHDLATESLMAHAKALEDANLAGAEHFVTNDIVLLLHVMERVSITNVDEAMPNITWPELLAVLALGEIDEACEWEQFYKRRKFPLDDSIYLTTLGPYAVEAMEAVCAAEALLRGDPTIHARRIISGKSRNAALKRHQATNNLNREFIQFYLAGTFKSMADAARRFLNSLPQNKKRLLAPTNAVRTLTNALSVHLKKD